MGGVVTKEQAISHAQYLDLVYSQSGTLYDLIPHVPRPTTDPYRLMNKKIADGVLGSVQIQMMTKYSKEKHQTATPLNQPTPSAKIAPSSISSADVNAIQSTKYSNRKKKGKNKSKKPDNQ